MEKNDINMNRFAVYIKRIISAALICLLILSLSGSPVLAGQTFPLMARDDLGREIELLEAPNKIVSLAPSHTEILFFLGLNKKVVGVTDYCNYPKEAQKKEKVGGFADLDMGKIVELKPDLILAFGIVQEPVIRKLEEKGEKVLWYCPHSVKEILALFDRIGEITGKPRAARRLREKVERRIRAVEEKIMDIPEDKRPTIFRVMGMDPPGTVGNDSFQSDIFRIAGGKNVFSDIPKDYFPVNIAAISERDPEIIIISGEDWKKARQKIKKLEGFKDLKAVRKDKILNISCDLICRPGPRTGEAIEKIAGYLHPTIFSFNPKRIISLGPALTEQLFLLGAGDRIVGVTIYCRRPKEAKNKRKVGTVVEINVEAILSLKPDLVITTPLTDSRQVARLKDLGIKVVNFSRPANFSQICEQYLELAKIVGREGDAREIINKTKIRTDSIIKKTKSLLKPKVFIQIGADPLFTTTKDSFINYLIESLGGINIASGVKSGLFSREEVFRQDPDIILIVTMGIVGEEERKAWERHKSLKAVKNNRVYIIDSDRLCSPTPSSFVDMLEEIFKIFHS